MQKEKNCFPENIVLIGMPGAGKSTLGSLLARQMDWAHVDTDALLESWWGLNLQALCDHLGLEAFLDAEADLIQKTHLSRCVISTGGSVIYRDRAMQALRRRGKIVYLRPALSALAARLTNMSTRGIAMRPEQTLADLYAERNALYMKYCDVELSTDSDQEDCMRQLMAQVSIWQQTQKACPDE